MPISDKTIQTLSKVNGVCKNWRDEISKSEDCRPSNYTDPKDVQNNTQGQGEMTENPDSEAGGDEPNGQPQLQEKYMRGDDIPNGYCGDSRLVNPGDDID